MISLLIGYVAGAVSAVVFPPVYRYVSNRVADAKDRFKDMS